MREIKFRAWDETHREMVAPTCIELWESGAIGVTPSYSDSNFELMQFTGLHDENGNEIYEGDILKSKKVSGIAQVYYDEMRLSFRYSFSYPPEKPMLKDLFETGELFRLGTKAYEVVGNIYENPDLLK